MSDRYKIYSELKFGVFKLEPGERSFDDIYELAKLSREDKDFSKAHYQLIDIRGCSFDFDKSKISEMIPLVEEYKYKNNQKLGVYVVDDPIATAYSQLFFNSIESKRELCSTANKAYNLLKLKITFEEFESLIDI